MPSLNITFTDEEHAQITKAAAQGEKSLKTFVREAAIQRSSEYNSRVLDLSAQIATWSADLNKRLA
jgi:uncharacterized protein (DUF1778 family)